MSPRAFHVPPRPPAAGPITVGVPPVIGIVISLREEPLMIPTARLSGDQKIPPTAPIDDRRTASGESNRRSQVFTPLVESSVQKATKRPSGDTAIVEAYCSSCSPWGAVNASWIGARGER